MYIFEKWFTKCSLIFAFQTYISEHVQRNKIYLSSINTKRNLIHTVKVISCIFLKHQPLTFIVPFSAIISKTIKRANNAGIQWLDVKCDIYHV